MTERSMGILQQADEERARRKDNWVYRHRWISWNGSFLCEKCGAVDRENTAPLMMGCPYSESER